MSAPVYDLTLDDDDDIQVVHHRPANRLVIPASLRGRDRPGRGLDEEEVASIRAGTYWQSGMAELDRLFRNVPDFWRGRHPHSRSSSPPPYAPVQPVPQRIPPPAGAAGAVPLPPAEPDPAPLKCATCLDSLGEIIPLLLFLLVVAAAAAPAITHTLAPARPTVATSLNTANISASPATPINLPAFPYAKQMASAVAVRNSQVWIIGGAMTNETTEAAGELATLRSLGRSLGRCAIGMSLLASSSFATGEYLLPPASPNPLNATGQTCHYYAPGDAIYCFGGQTIEQAPNESQFLRTLNTLSLATQSWEIIASGIPPRFGHGSVLLDSTLYVFSGISTNTAPSFTKTNDLWKTDVRVPSASGTATALGFASTLFAAKPPARAWSCLAPTADATSLVTFGGEGADGGVLSDTWVYAVAQDAWTDATPWFAASVVGANAENATMPEARKGHSCVAAGRGVWMFGGEDAHGGLLADLWFLDTAKWTWTQIWNAGGPRARAYHQSLTVGSYVLVTGGATAVQRVANSSVLVPTDRTAYFFDTVSETWITDAAQISQAALLSPPLGATATDTTDNGSTSATVKKYAVVAALAVAGGVLFLAAIALYVVTSSRRSLADVPEPPPLPSKKMPVDTPTWSSASSPSRSPSPERDRKRSAVFPVYRLSALSPLQANAAQHASDALRLSVSSMSDLAAVAQPIPPPRSASNTIGRMFSPDGGGTGGPPAYASGEYMRQPRDSGSTIRPVGPAGM
ncbi:Negative regulator of mitotic exit [Geranomyces variabilis]|nr:Negative regulator of mitotic exit [Geranomyces variabilis]